MSRFIHIDAGGEVVLDSISFVKIDAFLIFYMVVLYCFTSLIFVRYSFG